MAYKLALVVMFISLNQVEAQRSTFSLYVLISTGKRISYIAEKYPTQFNACNKRVGEWYIMRFTDVFDWTLFTS